MSDTTKRVKPSQAATITPIRESGKAIVQEVAQLHRQNKLTEHLHSGADIEKIPPTKWLLKGKIVKAGLTALYSEPGLGKSFVAIDMGMAAVLGEQWWGEYFAENSKVLYVAAERYSEVADRIRAACMKRGVSLQRLENFTVIAAPRPPHVKDDLDDLVEVAAKIKPNLIIFDTFARMSLDQDENSTKDMGRLVDNFLTIVNAAGEQCSGLIVHHAGKDKSKGLRGNTALLGALDAVLKLEKKDNALMLTVEKINAAETPLPAYFEIKSIDMPDTEEPGAVRSVGVLVSMPFGQFAGGIEADLLAIMTVFDEGVTLTKLKAEYNHIHKAPGKDARGVSEQTIRRAIKAMTRRTEVEKCGTKGNADLYKITAEALAAYLDKHPTE